MRRGILLHLLPPVMFGVTVLRTHSIYPRDSSMIRFSDLLRNAVLHAGRGGRHSELGKTNRIEQTLGIIIRMS